MDKAQVIEAFGVDPTTIGVRHRAYWIVEDKDIDMAEEIAGVKPGYLCVKSRDGGGNPIDSRASTFPSYFSSIEDDFDRSYRYYFFKPLEHSELLQAALPLIKYLNEHHHPHTQAVVTTGGVTLMEGVLHEPFTGYIKD